MLRTVAVLVGLLLNGISLCLFATTPDDNAAQLAEKLQAHAVKGQPAKTLILNKNVESVENAQISASLAKSLGFADEKRGPMKTVLTNPETNDASFQNQLKNWQTQGLLKNARVIEEPNPVALLELLISNARKQHQQDDAGFVAFLKTKNVAAKDAKLGTLDEAKLPRDTERGPLYYFAQRFFLEKALEVLKKRAAEVTKIQPELLYGGPYAGSIGTQGNWDAVMLHAWQTQAFSVPWVADRSWQNGEFSPQATGYLLALARAAFSPAPIFCDLHVGDGNYPAAIRRSFYQALAQGARGIRFVGAQPFSLSKTDEHLPVAQLENWKILKELTHEAGQLEPFLANAKTRHPDVGIVVSLTSELMNPELWVHEERKAIYHAARLSGHNVAMVTEEDLQEGRYRSLKSIYVVGSHLQRETVHVLNRWVKNDGSLGLVGGPWRDEFDQPLTKLHELMGISNASWETKQPAGVAKIQLAQLKKLENMHWNYEGLERDFPVVLGKLKYSLDPAEQENMKSYGTFADGSPAVTRRILPGTKGHVWTFGTPLGSAWFKTVLTGKPWAIGNQPGSYNHEILTRKLDGDMGDVVMAATGEARWDVITDNLAVETVILETPKKVGVFCINWSNQPQKVFLTAQFLPKELIRATSLKSGALQAQRLGITLSFKTTIDVTDVIMLEP